MLLAIDVGNTETVIGLFGEVTDDGGQGFGRAHGEHGLAYHWRLSTVPERTPDEHAMNITQLLALEGVDLRTAPFMYVAQRRQACRMIAAPFPAVLALVEQLKEEGRAMPTTPSLDDARVSVMGVL